MALERLDKVLAGSGFWSRREGKELLRRGRVTVDGAVVRTPETKVETGVSCVAVDGEPLELAEYTWIMLHKPAGVLTATRDPRQRTVLDLLPEYLRRRGLSPVGRLDKDTEGLLLLTNQGAAAHALLSPRRHVDKVYYARVEGQLEEADVAALAQGLVLEDGLACLPAKLEPLEGGRACRLTIREGKYHQVKRMLQARGKPVRYLKRLSMGGLELDPALEPGQWRQLRPEELSGLYLAAGISP